MHKYYATGICRRLHICMHVCHTFVNVRRRDPVLSFDCAIDFSFWKNTIHTPILRLDQSNHHILSIINYLVDLCSQNNITIRIFEVNDCFDEKIVITHKRAASKRANPDLIVYHHRRSCTTQFHLFLYLFIFFNLKNNNKNPKFKKICKLILSYVLVIVANNIVSKTGHLRIYVANYRCTSVLEKCSSWKAKKRKNQAKADENCPKYIGCYRI